MNRRDFIKQTAGVGATYGILGASRAIAADATAKPAKGDPAFVVRNDVTPYVADFIASARYSDLPPELIEVGKKSILDACGLALVGSKSKGGSLLRSYFDSQGIPHQGVRVLGTNLRLPLRFAAFANGVSIHMMDFDDTQLAGAADRVYGLMIHPTVPVFPAALGTADTMLLSGKDFMLGYHVGIEVETKITEACSPRAYKEGFHSTGTFGPFGSMAACAKLRGYTAEMIGEATAIAASQASGLSENLGTLMKPFHAGHAAEAGVIAVDLAKIGWGGAKNILEAPNGFFHAYGGTYNPDYLLNKLGKTWTFLSPGISIKPYPSGSLTHPAMSEMARLISDNKIRAEDVVQVEVGTNSRMPIALRYPQPQTGLEGKFSMQYCMAALLVAGKAGLGEFTDAVVSRPDMQDMIRKVRFYVDPEAEAIGFSKMTSILKIHLKDGRTISGRADVGKGNPGDPMSYDEVAEKFRGCASYAGWDADRASQIIEKVRHLEDVADMGTLTALCVS